VQIELCCVLMTACDTICGVVDLHRARTQIVSMGDDKNSQRAAKQIVLMGLKCPVLCRLAQAHIWVAYSVELQQQPA